MIDVEKLPLRSQGGLVEEFQALVDPRKPRGTRFELWTILSIAACASVSGALRADGERLDRTGDGTQAARGSRSTERRSAGALTAKRRRCTSVGVKDNQPTLRKSIADLHLEDAPTQVTSVTRGHGRIVTRRLWVTEELPTHLDFPHAEQVLPGRAKYYQA